jgi:hypothetical protein
MASAKDPLRSGRPVIRIYSIVTNRALKLLRCVACLVFALYFVTVAGFTMPRAAAAQDVPARTLTGTVTDAGSHEPLRGAVVQLQNVATNEIVSYLSDPDGHYRFLHLDANTDYRVFADYRDHRSHSHFISKFSSKSDLVVNLPIELH